MNIIRIAIKEVKVFRDVRMLVFMLATPILIMLILGTALSNVFNGSAAIGEIRILYENGNMSSMLESRWNKLVQEASGSGIHFEPASNREAALQDVQAGRYTGFATIAEDGISYTGNDRIGVENSIAQGVLAAFADDYKLALAMADGASVEGVPLSSTALRADYVQEASIDGGQQPSAMDYYAVAMTTLIIMYSAMTAGQLMDNERKRHTDIRLLASPVSRMEIFIGKIIGTLLLNGVFVLLIMLFSKYMFGVNWGTSQLTVFLVLASQIVYALGLGIGLSYIIKGNASGIVLMLIIQLEAMIGGSYFPADVLTGFFGALSQLSPMKWTNGAILQLIYQGSAAGVAPAMLFNIGAALVLLTLSVLLLRRREGL